MYCSITLSFLNVLIDDKQLDNTFTSIKKKYQHYIRQTHATACTT